MSDPTKPRHSCPDCESIGQEECPFNPDREPNHMSEHKCRHCEGIAPLICLFNSNRRPDIFYDNAGTLPFLRAYANAAADPTRTDLEDELMEAVRAVLLKAGMDLGLPPPVSREVPPT
jgi:hypothetical protein